MNRSEQAPMAVRCACVSWNRYTCWEHRYHMAADTTYDEIENDGGPCECFCHDRFDSDDNNY